MAGQPEGQAGELIDGSSLYLAKLWQIFRTDTFLIRLTDHDRTLRFKTALFFPVDALSTSSTTTTAFPDEGQSNAMEGMASRRELGGNETTTGMRGSTQLTSKLLTTSDLRMGKYRNARVDEYVIDWRFPFAGFIRHDRYWIGGVSYNGEAWEADLIGPSHRMEAKGGHIMTVGCPYELGDPNTCKASLPSPVFVQSGLIAGVGPASNEVTVAANFTEEQLADWFAFGSATFQQLSAPIPGDPARIIPGEAIDIATNGNPINGQMRVALAQELPANPPLGSQVFLTAGCDKAASTCTQKFDNIDNYGGYPWIVGTDRLLLSPSQT